MTRHKLSGSGLRSTGRTMSKVVSQCRKTTSYAVDEVTNQAKRVVKSISQHVAVRLCRIVAQSERIAVADWIPIRKSVRVEPTR